MTLTIFYSTKNPPDFVGRWVLQSRGEPSCRGRKSSWLVLRSFRNLSLKEPLIFSLRKMMLTIFYSTRNPPDFVRSWVLPSRVEPSCRGRESSCLVHRNFRNLRLTSLAALCHTPCRWSCALLAPPRAHTILYTRALDHMCSASTYSPRSPSCALLAPHRAHTILCALYACVRSYVLCMHTRSIHIKAHTHGIHHVLCVHKSSIHVRAHTHEIHHVLCIYRRSNHITLHIIYRRSNHITLHMKV